MCPCHVCGGACRYEVRPFHYDDVPYDAFVIVCQSCGEQYFDRYHALEEAIAIVADGRYMPNQPCVDFIRRESARSKGLPPPPRRNW